MKTDPTVTHWIAGLRNGDSVAAQQLWDLYFQRLVVLARGHLGVATRGGADHEDVAQSVFKSLCLGAERGRFCRLDDRHDLWNLLIVMTAHKSCDLVRRQGAQKRGGGRVLDEAALIDGQPARRALDDILSRDPTPEFAAHMAEQFEILLGHLNDAERRTAELKLQGFTQREIAVELDCAVRTVERRLVTVRRVWTAFLESQCRESDAECD